MKKIIILFLSLMNIFFFNALNVYKENDISNAYDLFRYNNGKYNETVVFNSNILLEESDNIIENLYSLAEENDVMIYTMDSGYLRYYIVYNQPLLDAFNLNGNNKIINLSMLEKVICFR